PLRRRALLPGRRPWRPGHPTRSAADLRAEPLRRDRTDPALGAYRGLVTHLRSAVNQSYWMSSVADDLSPRPSLPGDVSADIAIVGAGFTGLWTAYYLAKADPSLRIVVVEAQTAGFGASGRNGGWCSALFPQSLAAMSRRYGRDRALAFYRQMQSTV